MSGIAFFRGENPLRADKLNLAFSEKVQRTGDTMLGRLTMVGDPIAPLFDGWSSIGRRLIRASFARRHRIKLLR